jgi:DNA-binding transcriptional ArsR family regulator
MPEKLPLEPDLIEVLAADTRRDILSLLQDRRMTVTELSRELDLGKATIHEHLNKLIDAELVEREEDDRLWVYYRLTPRGKRLLNPQRTRFYLALAGALVAALVAGLAVYGFMVTGGFAGSEQATDPTAERIQEVDQWTGLSPTDREVYAGDAIEVPARGPGGEDVEAYLVDEDSASRIRQGDLNVRGLPLRAYTPTSDGGEVEARGNETVLRADASLEPGTYYLYVRSGGTDNAPSMPSIRLVGLEATPDRSTWYQHLDRGPLEINVTRDGQPVEGTLRLTGGPQVGTSPTAPVEDGQARLPAATLDELRAGTYRISVQPEDGHRWVDLPTRVTVTPAPLATVPLHVQETRPSPLRVHLEGPARLQALSPTVSGPATVETEDEGWTIGLETPEPGTVDLELARTSTSVRVHSSVAIDAEVHDGPEIHWTVRAVDGQPIADTAVYLDGTALGFTDANGTLVTELPDEGPHRLTIHRPDGETIRRAITVDGWRIDAASPPVSLEPVNVDARGDQARVTITLDNAGLVRQPVTLVAEVDHEPVASQALTLPAGGTLQTNLTVPVDAGRQQLTVDAHPLSAGPFAFANETSGDRNASDGGSDEDASRETDGTNEGSSTTVDLPGTEATDGQTEALDDTKLEPIQAPAAADGDAGMDAEESEAAESPGLGLVVAVGVLAGAAALVGRARKP